MNAAWSRWIGKWLNGYGFIYVTHITKHLKRCQNKALTNNSQR
jgi:hypothetical protein